MQESEDDVSFPLLIDDDELTNGAGNGENEDILDEEVDEVNQTEDADENDPDIDEKSTENFSNEKKTSDEEQPVTALQSEGGDDLENAENFTQQQIDGDFLAASGSKRKERSNAKSVECLDMDGKVLHIFKSGMEASQVLNIGQGEISLCCRGIKRSYMGYRFRFFGDDDKFDYSSKALKKGFGLESEHVYQPRPELMRATRASRGEWQQALGGGAKGGVESEKRSIMDVKDIKVRTWQKKLVKVGHFTAWKWVADVAVPTAAFKAHLIKASEQGKKSKRKGKSLSSASMMY